MLLVFLLIVTMKEWWRMIIFWLDGIDIQAVGNRLHDMSATEPDEIQQGLLDYQRIYEVPADNPLYGSEAALSRPRSFDI